MTKFRSSGCLCCAITWCASACAWRARTTLWSSTRRHWAARLRGHRCLGRIRGVALNRRSSSFPQKFRLDSWRKKREKIRKRKMLKKFQWQIEEHLLWHILKHTKSKVKQKKLRNKLSRINLHLLLDNLFAGSFFLGRVEKFIIVHYYQIRIPFWERAVVVLRRNKSFFGFGVQRLRLVENLRRVCTQSLHCDEIRGRAVNISRKYYFKISYERGYKLSINNFLAHSFQIMELKSSQISNVVHFGISAAKILCWQVTAVLSDSICGRKFAISRKTTWRE